ncbi:UDP-glucose-4-epimerase [Ophidiomyces ophidiicola]|uniref:UDP-glucose-4-epimerase n=1 Tax=Ophidiomyces ophidiicola TaxID=1387563 RepID=A0ACB8USY0_9EURO|nr:UDP-glucose-4-epimerase [Ophidiomyces ophidiicola]KAI2003861.1 UDP-glucose-4-epimerase [Ophidiomyces ophidiicola]KAI2035772.1 UDP-glucose-4-epimerase [Ophidiomyces ophidiicola]KAI2048221.1 UDP-glucose-4-epimerase [Ophidiomyces ophidiicola]KAI2064366.1 UDP-glucose-4-epimerase [Ophidiomyces ophidiicola]
MAKGSVLVTGRCGVGIGRIANVASGRPVGIGRGTGYIGSFTALALLEAGYDVVIADSLYNSSDEVLNRIELLCGKRPGFFKLNVTDEAAFDRLFEENPQIDSVIHFAALKAVGESVEKPLDYYNTNVYGTLCLLHSMVRHNVTNIVFSSSATVYGDATRFENMIPIPEECPLGPTNPYGNTKVFAETAITDVINAQRSNATKAGKTQDVEKWNAALLRYFNPAGAHPSGIMGEDPQGVPYNLLPLLAQVATGKREKLLVFGDDYASRDGTAIRDYIHILDLAAGHLEALNYLRDHHPGVRAWNLGTGKGSTVYDIIKGFSKAVGRDLPYEVVARRDGDVLDLTSNPSRANRELGWKAQRTLEQACEDLWRWTEYNPQGYRQSPPEDLLEKLKASSKP